jgi:hypothetical protein
MRFGTTQSNLVWSASRCVVFTLILGLLSGCVLPWPHTTVRMDEINGKVLDERTHAPIPGVRISLTYHPEISSKSRVDGSFKIKQINNWHFGYTAVVEQHDYPSGQTWEPEIVFSHTNYLRRWLNAEDVQTPQVFYLVSLADAPPSLIFNGRGEILEDHGAGQYLKSVGIRCLYTSSNYVVFEVGFGQTIQKPMIRPENLPELSWTDTVRLPHENYRFSISNFHPLSKKDKTSPLDRRYRLEVTP